jgi:hypothetical protein
MKELYRHMYKNLVTRGGVYVKRDGILYYCARKGRFGTRSALNNHWLGAYFIV